MSNFVPVATTTVLAGSFIPAHDETFDLAESIGTRLDAFREYVASVRDAEQADNAVAELLAALYKEANKPEHTFRVVNERTGRVAYDGPSFEEAGAIQTGENMLERAEGREPFFRLWIMDQDGIGCTVNTQQPTR